MQIIRITIVQMDKILYSETIKRGFHPSACLFLCPLKNWFMILTLTQAMNQANFHVGCCRPGVHDNFFWPYFRAKFGPRAVFCVSLL